MCVLTLTMIYYHTQAFLSTALTDFLRATCEIPLITMTTRGAKTYINPEMKAAWEKLIENEESFTAQEAEYLDIHTMDKLTKLEYDLWNCPHDMATRSKDKGQTMPYLTRAEFGRLLRIFMMLDPVCLNAACSFSLCPGQQEC